MRKFLLATLVLLLWLGGEPGIARADGAIFPVDFGTGYLAVRYHNVTVDIDGPHAVTHVEQEFYNPYDRPVQGRYLFPVPPGAVISRFEASLDGESQTVTRQDANTTNAALRPMVANRRDPRLLQYLDWESLTFDLNLAPHSARRMIMSYHEVLAPTGGLYRYHYVLSTETYSSEPLQKVSVTVNLRSPGGLTNVYSGSHPVTTEWLGPGAARSRWQAENVRPSEDFDLFYATAAGGFGGGLLTGRRAGRNHFLFLFSPESGLGAEQYLPKDIVFVIDRSGSMQGAKIGQARQALEYFLGQLGEDDRFAILSFNHQVSSVSETLQPPNSTTLANARSYLDRLSAEGSTDIDGALRRGLAVVESSQPRPGAAQLLVFLTDGLPTTGVTDTQAILRQVGAANNDRTTRLHVFGVGYDVNTHFLDRLAAGNGGSVNYVQPGEDLELSLKAFYDRVAHPVLTEVKIAFDGMQVSNLYPQDIPDLFAGSSLLLVGEYRAGAPAATVHVRGKAAGREQEYTYRFDLEQTGGQDFVPRLWATRRVGALLDQVRVSGEKQGMVDEIRQLGLGYGIITPYTGSVIAAQTEGAASAANMLLYQDQRALNQASGRVTIQARVQNQAYQQAQQANVAAGANILNNRQYSLAQLGDPQAGGLNVDLAVLQKGMPTDQPLTLDWIQRNLGIARTVDYGSEEYFKLASDPEARPALQSGVNVVFNYQGKVVLVRDPAQGAQNTGTTPSQQINVQETVIGSLSNQIVRTLEQLGLTLKSSLDRILQMGRR